MVVVVEEEVEHDDTFSDEVVSVGTSQVLSTWRVARRRVKDFSTLAPASYTSLLEGRIHLRQCEELQKFAAMLSPPNSHLNLRAAAYLPVT